MQPLSVQKPDSLAPVSKLLSDQFIQYGKSEVCRVKELIQPRAIFVSLTSLWRDWKQTPFDVLYSSLMIFYCKKEWILGDESSVDKFGSHYHRLMTATNDVCIGNNNNAPQLNNIQTKKMDIDAMAAVNHNMGGSDNTVDRSAVATIKKHILWMAEKDTPRGFDAFKAFLFEKEKQNRLLWVDPTDTPLLEQKCGGANTDMDCDDTYANESDLMDIDSEYICDHRWALISQWLTTIRDPIREEHYSPLITQPNWWIERIESFEKESQLLPDWNTIFVQMEHTSDRKLILNELSNLAFKFAPLLEIIRQSNLTLIPMSNFDSNVWSTKALAIVQFRDSLIKYPHKNQFTVVGGITNTADENTNVSSDKCAEHPCLQCADEPLVAIDSVAQLRATVEIFEDDGFVYLN